MQGRTVALQGDNSVAKYDLFEEGASHVLYWGTFRGNGYYGAEESHSFTAPFPWLANLVNAKTRRAYGIDVADFSTFVGIATQRRWGT